MFYRLKKTSIPLLKYTVRFNCISYKDSTQIRYQRAFLSLKVIDTVAAPINLLQFSTQTLTSKILHQMSLIQSQMKFDPISKHKICQLFQDGIQLNKSIFPNKLSIMSESDLILQPKKLKFFPTYIITNKIFRLILQKDAHYSYNSIATGLDGISKTTSMILFWYLAKYIDQFRFGLTQQQKNNYNYKELLQKLYKIPKFVYWSITPIQYKELIRILLQQCPQFKHNKIIDQKFQIYELKNFYKSNFENTKFVLGCDHINQVIVQCQLYQKLREKKLFQQINIQKVGRNKYLLDKLVPWFDFCLFLSSMTVQQSFYKRINFGGRKGQYAVTQQFVDYAKIYNYEKNIYQQVSYYLFQIENQILNYHENKIHLSQNIKKQINDQCFNFLNQHKHEYFVKPLQIKSYVMKMKQNNNLFQQIKNNNIQGQNNQQIKKGLYEDLIVKQFKKMVVESSQECLNYIINNLIKKDVNNNFSKTKLIDKLYNLCIDLVKKQQQNKQNNKYVQYQIDIDQLTMDQQMINKYVDKTIFFYQFESSYIKLQYPLPLMIKSLQFLISNQMKYYQNTNIEFLEKYFVFDDFQNLIKRIFILSLIKKNITFCFWINKINNHKRQFNFNNQGAYAFKPISQIQQSLNQNQQQNFQYKQPYKSNQMLQMSKQQINKLNLKNRINLKRKNKFHFLDGFISSIQKTIQQKAKTRLFLPNCDKAFQNIHLLTQNFILQMLESNSKLIDFVILNIPKIRMQDIKTIQIWAINIKTEKQDVRQQLKEFISQFITFQDRNQTIITIDGIDYRVQLHFYVFAPTVALQPLFDDFNNIFDGFIQFTKGESSDICKISKLDGEQNCLLQSIGYIDITQNCEFVQPNEDILNLKMVLEVMKSKQKQKQQNEKFDKEDE